MTEPKITLQEIIDKAGVTQQQLVEAMVAESKKEQKIIDEATRQAKKKQAEIKEKIKAVVEENNHMHALIDNHYLSKEWSAIQFELEEMKAEAQKSNLEIVKQPEAKA